MSFVEGIQQYQNSTASNTQTSHQVRDGGAVRPLTAQAQELIPGKVFEGTITDIKNGQVTIGLNDGRTISARLDSGVTLEQGQPMLFEVKSNNGEQIAIRPVTIESAQNPTLLKALEAAGLKVSDRNLSMVNQMMAEQLPIDKNSLLQMLRVSASFPKADMQTLVQMQKLGFVITEESLNQFQNYKNGQQAILPEMNRLMEGIAELPGQLHGLQGNGTAQMSGGAASLLGFQQQIIGVLLGSQPQPVSDAQMGNIQNQAALGQMAQNQAVQNLSVTNIDATQGVIIHQDITEGGENQTSSGGDTMGGNTMGGNSLGEGLFGESLMNGGLSGEQLNGGLSGDNLMNGELSGEHAVKEAETAAKENAQSTAVTAEQVLTGEQQNKLTTLLQEFSGARNEAIFPNGRLNTSLSAGELLQQIISAVENSEDYTSASVQRLFQSEEYKGLLKQAMTDQWLLTPEKLKEEGAVKELYQRLSKQMEELQQVLSQTGKESTTLAKTAQSVQSNLEFMNQVNQVYTYVQLPLKLQNQNTHSDLYVYTNKKSLREKDGELTALLHLDMEHLGTTDIFVKLQGTAVETEFYFEDADSCRLILEYAGELEERLENKGYSCQVKVENRRKQQEFVQDFLEREKPSGKLHRYSFDVKA